MLKILIADDHAIVREGLKRIIDEAPDMCVADEATSGQEALGKLRENDYDVVILDISMPEGDGFDTLAEIRRERAKLPVLMLSIHTEEQFAVSLLKAGASGYLTKGSAPEELVEAIRKVSQGRKYVSESLAEKLAFNLEEGVEGPPHVRLSDRELQVLRMIGMGKTVSEIAAELFLSVKTVSTYRARVLDKMNMANNAELMHYAMRNGLVP